MPFELRGLSLQCVLEKINPAIKTISFLTGIGSQSNMMDSLDLALSRQQKAGTGLEYTM